MIGPVLNNMRETEIWLENEVNARLSVKSNLIPKTPR